MSEDYERLTQDIMDAQEDLLKANARISELEAERDRLRKRLKKSQQRIAHLEALWKPQPPRPDGCGYGPCGDHGIGT